MRRTNILGSTVLTTSALTTAILFSSAALAQSNAPPPSGVTPGAVVAAKDSSGLVSELIVTARKREERLIEVPLSIQAFSSAEIKASGIDDLQTLKDRAGFTVLSQVSTGAGGRSQGAIVFRGLQGVTFTTAQQNSGSLFIDGIFISGAPQSVNTVDVDRIEVLKGPQNAYFGRSTFGGAINFITRKPSDTFGGEINGRVTARGSFDGDASLEGPLIPGKLDARVSIYDHQKAATYHASDGGDLGAEQTRGVVGTLYFKPTEHAWLRLRGTYQQDDDSTADQAYLPARLYGAPCTGTYHGTDAAGNSVPVTLTKNYFCSSIPTLSQLGVGIIDANTAIPANLDFPLNANRAYSALHPAAFIRFLDHTPRLGHGGLRRDIVRGSFQGGYNFDNGSSLDVNVGYNDARATYSFDIDHSKLNYFFNIFANIDTDFTADIRYSSNQTKRLRGLLGASFFYSRNQTDRISDDMVFGSPPGEGLFTDNRNKTPSVYASVDFDVLSFLTATAEARYESEQDKAVDKFNVVSTQKFNSFLPRFIVKFHPTRDLNIYASFAEGAQPATLNGSFVSADAKQRAYILAQSPGQSIFSPQPTIRAYEIGIKQTLLNGRVEYALDGYLMNWRNEITVSSLFNPPACNIPGQSIFNTAACPLLASGSSLTLPNDARLKGVEFESSAHITSDIDLSVTADYKDPRWTKYYDTGLTGFAGGVNHFNGNYLPRVPAFQGTLTGSFHHPLNDVWTGFARADANYTGRAWDSSINIVKTDPYVRVNARLGVERRDLTLELFATNLLNDTHWDYAAKVIDVTELTFTQQGVLVQPAPRREFGVRFQYKFR